MLEALGDAEIVGPSIGDLGCHGIGLIFSQEQTSTAVCRRVFVIAIASLEGNLCLPCH